MFYYSVFLMMLMSFLFVVFVFISEKYLYNREKLSPYECGFECGESTYLPFSIRFFLLTVLFLVFDVEVILLLPTVKPMSLYFYPVLSFLINMLYVVLFFGFLYEWLDGSIRWV